MTAALLDSPVCRDGAVVHTAVEDFCKSAVDRYQLLAALVIPVGSRFWRAIRVLVQEKHRQPCVIVPMIIWLHFPGAVMRVRVEAP